MEVFNEVTGVLHSLSFIYVTVTQQNFFALVNFTTTNIHLTLVYPYYIWVGGLLESTSRYSVKDTQTYFVIINHMMTKKVRHFQKGNDFSNKKISTLLYQSIL